MCKICLMMATSLAAFGQQVGPVLTVDARAGQHAISPDIYGINFFFGVTSDPATVAAAYDVRATARRWGGNGTSTYHWKYDVNNLGLDWFFQVLPSPTDQTKLPEGSQFNMFADQTRTSGGKIIATAPVLGWLPKGDSTLCSYDVGKYGKQCKHDPYSQYHPPYVCGDGIVWETMCGDPASQTDGMVPMNPQKLVTNNDPTDASVLTDESFQAEWAKYLISRYGKANQGGATIYALDNEPIWWDSNHRDIHPLPYTYDELFSVDARYAAAIKQADPTALISGPVSDNWSSLFFSKKDIVAGQAAGNWWGNPVDRNAHGGVALMPWYLQQMKNYEQQHGKRLLDYLDVHAYIGPSNPDGPTRLAATREFWDPSYMVTGDYWIDYDDKTDGTVGTGNVPTAPMFIPRVKALIANNYPGTKLAITEYAYGALDTLNGALAQADLLGIFGREGLDLATLWGPPKSTDPGAFAFKIYRNYDGIGGAFGDAGVQASSADQSQLAVYAAVRGDLNLTAMVINKTGNDLTSALTLSNFAAGTSGKAWRYSGANLGAIVAAADVAVSGGVATTTFPANSITLLAIPPASYPVPKPAIAAVTNVASYGKAIAPGQMVVLFGAAMGPAKLAHLTQDANTMVSTTNGGVRILFDGVPAPIIYVSATQCAAVVPYFGAIKTTTHVQVEYQGVRSDPFPLNVSATAPGLFTFDASGKGQAAMQNEDGVTPNSKDAPAKPGSVVILWATGEGITNPPGVDGRLAVDVVPKPVATVTVDIGGMPATVQYAGAAPGNMPGLLQINAQMASGVAPGDNVPVHVTIGGVTSPDGVTMSVH